MTPRRWPIYRISIRKIIRPQSRMALRRFGIVAAQPSASVHLEVEERAPGGYQMGQFIKPELIEPFVAPEFFCTDLAFLEMAAPGIVRFGLMAECEGAPAILRVRVLLPVSVIPRYIARTTTFLAASAVQRTGAHSAMLM